MDNTRENPGRVDWTALLHGLRPAMPAVIGAAALTFLFAAVMPMVWVAGISWNLYLDYLFDFFVPPVGNGGRLALALGMAMVAAIITSFVAPLITKPEAAGRSSLRRPLRPSSEKADGGALDEILARRRRVDLHPDDAPRPPIRAGRDLPAGGLAPQNGSFADERGEPDLWLGEPDVKEHDELVLADLAPGDFGETGNEPWLQSAETTGPALPDPADNSLGAMVARLEMGITRRQQAPDAQTATASIPVPAGALPAIEPEVDLALEAALSTLQRMTRQSVG